MDFIEHKIRFDEQQAALALPVGCSEPCPATFIPHGNVYSWRFRWVIVFPDHKYIQIRERWKKIAGLQEARRERFAYHYGSIGKVDGDGVPIAESSDPVDLRIDNSGSPVHLHYCAPEPHYMQDQVKNLALDTVGMFDFIKAVLRHRQKGIPLHKALDFRV